MFNSSSTEKKIPTNEEVVEGLTKDLEVQCSTDGNDESEQTNIPGCSENETCDTESNEADDGDYINEEVLKDLELTLSDSDKEARQKEALQLKDQGNDEFKKQEYQTALKLYTDALRLCPLNYPIDRSILYANRGATKKKLNLIKSAIEDCSKSIELNDKYLKAYIRRANLYEEDDKLDESLEDYKQILQLDSSNKEANIAVQRLPPKIEKRNEELKTEMLGKLKDLGNLVLRPFGLSTENFKMQQDPSTGGYSINFQNNK